ncbi:Na+/H+ antiporter subunit E [Kushneria phosphatilytica]|uniref:Na+/H+ antiporter subunit E n=1 Tax=Kushneria phosphatilytica TaxID=657387 RepID=A0A1S1NYH1_9GAMM|nr:Na+/H+ antiporter subunit E [Kushneria phosphatilytica]OHV12721.1 Na+/H+ antiporter subunit E [Kushneria phosphatilytica]QEL10564.1 Na+/H+ antiporter subunit E [Kushneria phosphatilytica]
MKRLLPMPLLSLLLFVIWMCLTALTPGNALLALVLALLIPILIGRFWEPQPTVHRPLKLVAYIAVLIWDIIVANLEVSRLILAPRRQPRPAFVLYPLSLTEPFPITILASTISLTPGTISAHLRMHDGTLLIHALDVEDTQALIEQIQRRYEQPLKEIFQC